MSEVSLLVDRARSITARPAERNRAFGELVRRFQDMAYGYAYGILGDSHLAQDASQEAFIAAWQSLDRLEDPEAFPGWFKRIVLFHCHRMTRGKKLEICSLEVAADVESRDGDPWAALERLELGAWISAAIRSLPEHERLVTALFYVDDYSLKEIASFLEIRVTTVKKRLHSARKRLRERLLEMLRDTLREERPSRNARFAGAVELFNAIEAGDARQVAQLLAGEPALVHARHDRAVRWNREPLRGETSLHLSAARGEHEIAELLLHAGADPNARDAGGWTPLHCAAAECARTDVAELLLRHGAGIDETSRTGLTPVALAARCAAPAAESWADHWGIAEFLLARDARMDLFTAAALDRTEAAAALLETDPEALRRTGPEGETALHWAARAGFRRVARLLLASGADPDAEDNRGRTPLRWAAQPGERTLCAPTPVAAMLLERGARQDVFTAAILGDLDELERMLEAEPVLAQARDGEGATALCLAAWHGREPAVELLLDRGADPNAADDRGRTAASVRYRLEDYYRAVGERLLAHGAQPDLGSALALGRLDLVEMLLAEDPGPGGRDAMECAAQLQDAGLAELFMARGVRPDVCQAAALGLRAEVEALLDAAPVRILARDGEGRSSLHWAAARGDRELAELLLSRGAGLTTRSCTGETPLHAAVAQGNREVAELLISHGADLHARDFFQQSPLFTAVRHGRADLVEMLLRMGEDPLSRGNGNMTPLHRAAEQGDPQAAAALLRFGADADARNYWGGTALHLAAQNGHTALVELLLDQGAWLEARDGWERTALHAAAWHGHLAVAQLLLERGAEIDCRDRFCDTPLHKAAARGHLEVAGLFVDRGLPVDVPSDWGRTPLHTAAQEGETDMVRVLLGWGADLNARTCRGGTALHRASERGHDEVAGGLLDAGADLHAIDERGRTPLHGAAWNGHEQVARLLLDRGARVAAATSRGNTPLHTAVQAGRIGAAAILLSRGAPIHARNHWGSTPLHAAAWHGHADVARLLLEFGADPDSREGSGKTPLEQAAERGHEPVVALLGFVGDRAGGTLLV